MTGSADGFRGNDVISRQEMAVVLINALKASLPEIISEKEINFPFRATARVRYNQSDQPATIDITEDGLVKARFDEPQRAVTSGQSLVIYSDEVVLGGGKII